jgi:hypothetical protein
MCLCKQIENRVNLVCPDCHYSRKTFRTQEQPETCPTCRKKLIDIGSRIAVPKKKDWKNWKILTAMIAVTDVFPVCQCGSRIYH